MDYSRHEDTTSIADEEARASTSRLVVPTSDSNPATIETRKRKRSQAIYAAIGVILVIVLTVGSVAFVFVYNEYNDERAKNDALIAEIGQSKNNNNDDYNLDESDEIIIPSDVRDELLYGPEKPDDRRSTRTISHEPRANPIAELYTRRERISSQCTECETGGSRVGWRCDLFVNDQLFRGWGTSKTKAKKIAAVDACSTLYSIQYNITFPGVSAVKIACGDTTQNESVNSTQTSHDASSGQPEPLPDPVAELIRQGALLSTQYTECKNGKAKIGWRCDLSANDQPFQGWGRSKRMAKKSAAAAACLTLYGIQYNITVPDLPAIKKACGDATENSSTTHAFTPELLGAVGSVDQNNSVVSTQSTQIQTQFASNPLAELNNRGISVSAAYYRCLNRSHLVGWKCDLLVNSTHYFGYGRSKKIAKTNAASNACKSLFNYDYDLPNPNFNAIQQTCLAQSGNITIGSNSSISQPQQVSVTARSVDANPAQELHKRNPSFSTEYNECKNGTVQIGWQCRLTVDTLVFNGWGVSKRMSKRYAAAQACNSLYDLHYNVTVPNLATIQAVCDS